MPYSSPTSQLSAPKQHHHQLTLPLSLTSRDRNKKRTKRKRIKNFITTPYHTIGTNSSFYSQICKFLPSTDKK
ncbi:uncharacterized protein LODBEIA_P03520 [Lodderomyces beijingensis]|uniref:Uncharacterized protein n=1 Tax=Lodderomyces beijingensis TaxID=1775926 RepID=A0ABP0ZD81_9ASCO